MSGDGAKLLRDGTRKREKSKDNRGRKSTSKSIKRFEKGSHRGSFDALKKPAPTVPKTFGYWYLMDPCHHVKLKPAKKALLRKPVGK